MLLVAVAASAPNTVLLNNGVVMPSIAFAASTWPAEICYNATLTALRSGFRFIWSSALVGKDCQDSQATAIAVSGVPRSSIFIAGTVDTQRCTSEKECHNQTLAGGLEQMSGPLGTAAWPDGIDMLMLDFPSAAGCEGIAGQWSALSELYFAHSPTLAPRSIAVSNFGQQELACLFPPFSSPATPSAIVPPVVNQLSFSVGHGSTAAVGANGAHGILVQAYSPLGGGRLVHDPLLQQIGAAHGKSAAQVALRWIIQHNATVATQSTNAAHLKEDLSIFDFSLTPSEMATLDAHAAPRHASQARVG